MSQRGLNVRLKQGYTAAGRLVRFRAKNLHQIRSTQVFIEGLNHNHALLTGPHEIPRSPLAPYGLPGRTRAVDSKISQKQETCSLF